LQVKNIHKPEIVMQDTKLITQIALLGATEVDILTLKGLNNQFLAVLQAFEVFEVVEVCIQSLL
jgi:hypothetical protein